MSYALVLPALLFRRGGLMMGTLGLIAAVLVFSNGVTPVPAPGVQLLLILYVLAAPLAGYLAGLLVSEYCVQGLERSPFPQLGALAAFVFMLSSPQAFDFFGLAYLGLAGRAGGEALVSVAGLASSVILITIVTSLALVLMVAMIELPCRWVFSASALRVHIPFGMLRPLLAIFILCLAFQILAGEFLRVFDPGTVLNPR